MGMILSGEVADWTLYRLGEKKWAALSAVKERFGVRCWLRYRDDIFIIYRDRKLFDSYLGGFRRAISAHYASAHCRFLPGAEPVADMRPYLLLRGRAQEACI